MSTPSMPAPPFPPPTTGGPRPSRLDAIFKLGVLVGLAVLIFVTTLGAIATHAGTTQQRGLTCLGVQYEYVSDAESEVDRYEKIDFSAMDALSRAQADLLDCDVEGR